MRDFPTKVVYIDASKPSNSFLPLENPTDCRLSFRIRVSDKSQYEVSPYRGYVEPHSSILIKLRSLRSNNAGTISKVDIYVRLRRQFIHRISLILQSILKRDTYKGQHDCWSMNTTYNVGKTVLSAFSHLFKAFLFHLNKNFWDVL